MDLCKTPCADIKVHEGNENPKDIEVLSLVSNANSNSQLQNYIFKDGGIVRLYFRTTIMRYTITEDYTALSMIGEIGGYVGLLLGVAAVDIIHVIDRIWPKLRC